MHLKDTKDTPPSSPNICDIMDNNDLFEEDVVEVSDSEIAELDNYEDSVTSLEQHVDEAENGVDDLASDEGVEPIRDDAICVFSEHEGSVFCCHLEPKTASLAVTGGEDDMAYVWETRSGEVVLKCTGHKDSVNCVGFSFDGSYVATGDMGGIVQVWRMSTKSLAWETNVGDLEWLRWHHGANVLLGATISGEIYMWRIPGGECKLLPGNGKKAECGVILPDGRRAAVGYEDGSIKIFDMKATTVLHHIPEGQAHCDSLTDMGSHPDNNLLITSSVDGRAVISKTQTGKVVTVLNCRERGNDSDVSAVSVEAVGFYQDSRLPLAATGTLDGLLCIWDVSRGVERHKIQQESGITKLFWDKNNPLIYTAALDGSISLYDARDASLLKQFLGHSNGILDISLSANCDILLSTSYDGTARVYSVQGLDR